MIYFSGLCLLALNAGALLAQCWMQNLPLALLHAVFVGLCVEGLRSLASADPIDPED